TKGKNSADEFRLGARPASTDCSAQEIKVKGITLLRQAWNRRRRQTARSVGIDMRCQRNTPSNTTAAIVVRGAISVTRGIDSTPSLMNVYDAPQSMASSNSSA